MLSPQAILRAHGVEPKRSLGQNFLADAGILERIVQFAELSSEDTVIEVGAGLGHLTALLAQNAKRVLAVEIDQRLRPILAATLAPYPNITLLQADILQLDFERLLADKPYKVAANLPYYITGAILRRFLASPKPPQLMVLTVQQEVASRLTASPGKMSLLAVSVGYFGELSRQMKIGAGAFYPRPKVDSAVIKIDLRHERDWGVSPEIFFRVARAGFAQKRKQLKNNLRALGLPAETIANAFQQSGIAGSRRAQTLSVAEWALLARVLYPK